MSCGGGDIVANVRTQLVDLDNVVEVEVEGFKNEYGNTAGVWSMIVRTGYISRVGGCRALGPQKRMVSTGGGASRLGATCTDS
jgi:hypothetical protein